MITDINPLFIRYPFLYGHSSLNDPVLNNLCLEYFSAICNLHRHIFSVVGAHRLGKSELVKRLSNLLDNCSRLNDVSLDNPFPKEMRSNQTLRSTFWMSAEHVNRLMQILFSNTAAREHIVICDRSEYDPYLYYTQDSNLVSTLAILGDISTNELRYRPYNNHIILIDDEMNEQSENDCTRKDDIDYFAAKRSLYYKFFTTTFDDVLIIDKSTPIGEIIDWIKDKANEPFIEFEE